MANMDAVLLLETSSKRILVRVTNMSKHSSTALLGSGDDPALQQRALAALDFHSKLCMEAVTTMSIAVKRMLKYKGEQICIFLFQLVVMNRSCSFSVLHEGLDPHASGGFLIIS
jgi:hypothetical protein